MRRLTVKYLILLGLSSILITALWLLRNRAKDSLQSNEAETRPWERRGVIMRHAPGIPTGSRVAGPKRGMRTGSVQGVRVSQRRGTGATTYVMAWRYSGQQAAGIQGLASLQCWAGQSGLHAQVVEPVMRHNELTSSLKPDATGTMRLADYFDLKFLNTVSTKAGYAPVIERGEFLRKAPKYVIFIRSEVHDRKEEVVWSSNSATECYTENREGDTMGRAYDELHRLGYCIVRVAVTQAGRLTHDKMMSILGEWADRNVILIVSLWKGPMALKPKCKGIGGGSAHHHFYPSQRLLQDAQRYNLQHIHNGSYTAVMIRLEHATMLVESSPKEHSIEGCLRDLARSVEKAKQRTGGHLPVVTADIGKYGTNTWKWSVKDQQQLKAAINNTWEAMAGLLGHSVSLEEWEDTFVAAAGGVTNEGYIAALQRVLASRADCLVLMGGGSFQQKVLQEYLYVHRDERKWCIELVCQHFKEQLTGVIESARKARPAKP